MNATSEQNTTADTLLLEILAAVKQLRAAQGITDTAWYTYAQAADLAQLSPATIYRAIKAGKLQSNNGADMRISGKELHRWIAAGCPTGRNRADVRIAAPMRQGI